MVIGVGELRKGITIELDGEPYQVVEYSSHKMQQRAPVVRLRLKDLRTGRTIDKTYNGYNVSLTLAQVDNRPVQYIYEDGEFSVVTLKDEDALEALWNKEYSLTAITAPDQFKSYDDLKKRLDYVLGAKPPTRKVYNEDLEDESEGRGSFTPDFKSKAPVAAAPVASASADEDDALTYFQKLAEE